MVVNLHTGASGVPTDARQLYDATHGGSLGLYEVFVFTRRPLWFMVFGGVFDRHPDLKVVISENGVQWLPSLVRDMEQFFDVHGGAPIRSSLKMRPSEYFDRHVFLGGSLMKRYEAEIREEIGVDRLMWGADYPHLEGAVPVHRLVLQHVFGGLPEEDLRRILGHNAIDVWGFDADLLQAVADRVGPTVEDLADADRHRRHPTDLQLEPGAPGSARGRGCLTSSCLRASRRSAHRKARPLRRRGPHRRWRRPARTGGSRRPGRHRSRVRR